MIQLFVGIDISKDTLDISITSDGRSFHFEKVSNDEEGFGELWSSLCKAGCRNDWRITLEATSAYHRQVVHWFWAKGVGILVLNPKQARDLARGLGILHKSDPADARVLALCSMMAWREPTPLPSGVRQELQEISRRIGVLTDQRSDEQRRKKKPGPCKALLESCERMVAHLDQEIARLSGEWILALEGCPELQETYRLIQTVPGVGPKTARVVVSELYVTERERTVRECVAYAGIAPHEQTSGVSMRRPSRTLTTGNSRLRRALFMGSVCMLTRDAESRALYQRIVGKGKPKKVGVVAVMNKLMRRIASVAQRGTAWVPA